MEEVTFNADEFRAFVGKTSVLPTKVKTGLRNAIREIADDSILEMKHELARPPLTPKKRPTPKGHESSKGLRKKIAEGLGRTVAASDARQGVFITAKSTHLPKDQKKLLKKYNSEKGWRHPDLGTAKKIARAKKGAAILNSSLGEKSVKSVRDRGGWAAQKGRPYFGKVLSEQKKTMHIKIEKEMELARKSAGLG